MNETALRFSSFFRQAFDGNPFDMIAQGIAGILGAVLGVWLRINPFVGIYVALVAIDTGLGIAKSKRQGRPVRWSRLLWGPGEKIVFAGMILAASEYVVEFTGPWLTRSVASYISTVLFLEAVAKYDYLSGKNVLEHIRTVFSSLVTSKTKRKK